MRNDFPAAVIYPIMTISGPQRVYPYRQESCKCLSPGWKVVPKVLSLHQLPPLSSAWALSLKTSQTCADCWVVIKVPPPSQLAVQRQLRHFTANNQISFLIPQHQPTAECGEGTKIPAAESCMEQVRVLRMGAWQVCTCGTSPEACFRHSTPNGRLHCFPHNHLIKLISLW